MNAHHKILHRNVSQRLKSAERREESNNVEEGGRLSGRGTVCLLGENAATHLRTETYLGRQYQSSFEKGAMSPERVLDLQCDPDNDSVKRTLEKMNVFQCLLS